MSDSFRIPYLQLSLNIQSALESAGVSAKIAQIEAEIMTESDLMGVPSHGVRMLPALLKGIREGRATSNPKITILRDYNAICTIDGDNGPGRFVSFEAMKRAVEKAKKFGIGACLLTNATHWGRAFAYAFRAAQAGTIGICMTNAIPNMLAWQSRHALLGNNPLGIGIPQKDKEPIVLDMAMSQAAFGKVGTYAREGKETPTGWGLDVEGNATTDPRLILKSGRLIPFGEHKGSGLSFMIELLTGALAGTMLSHEIMQIDRGALNPGTSKLFIALDVDAFGSIEQLSKKTNQFIAWIKEIEPDIEIMLPGSRSWKAFEENLQNGVPLHPEIVEELKNVGVIL
jgi:LDH2 family malate/lactate/ureidoglycolate dehydrogenase